MTVWDDEDFMARRMQARKRLETLVGAAGGTGGDRLAWFDKVYELAGDDAAQVPWADLAPKGPLVRWLADNPAPANGPRFAVDVACGLGDNAEALAAAGYEVTAFDLSGRAIDWAKRRFAQTRVEYMAADLFDLPRHWARAFNLVHETYTIQALSGDLRRKAIQRIALLVAPRGRLLVICRGRDDDEAVEGPPWPLSRAELAAFRDEGLEEIRFDDFLEVRDRPIRHFMVEYERP